MHDPFPIFYSLRDISARLGFSPRAIRDWIAQGRFGPRAEMLEVAGEIRIPWAAVQRFLESCRLAPAPDPRAELVHDGAGRFVKAGLKDMQPPIPARTLGELRRKTSRPQEDQ